MEFLGTDRFKLVRRLGAGGMGLVYEVYDTERGVSVALKCVQTNDAQSLMQLKQEFRSLCDLPHPNLVSLGELVEDGGQWFFTMELVSGHDFRRYVRPADDSEDHPPPSDKASTARRSQSSSPASVSSSSSASSSMLTKATGPSSSEVATAALASGSGAAPLSQTVEPSPPLPTERTPARFDELRLRASLKQLAHALATLHADEKVHLDIKPSNLLVTPEGRVVVLDFGLVRMLTRAKEHSGKIMGTPAYMAPEQLSTRQVGPSADWYSVGVLLYEALTGARPPKAELRLRALPVEVPFPRPGQLVEGVPPDLEQLCMDLLSMTPSERPREWDILQRLGVVEERRHGRTARTEAELSFTGRRAELERLGSALEQGLSGRGLTFIVQGESGLGKTALVERFCERASLKHTGLLILNGRCHAREAVPFRAFDGIVDGLLMAAPEDADAVVATLASSDRQLLEATFPVLIRERPSEAAGAAGSRGDEDASPGGDPQERRQRMFSAMRTLFAALAARRPLMLVIDDLQWADGDSFALLREVLRDPQPALLLLATVRAAGDSPWMPSTNVGAQPLGPSVEHLLLSPLPQEDAARLAAQLMEGGWASSEAGLDIAREAHGHPLFIRELARSALGTHRKGMQLELVLRERIRNTRREERELMGLVSVSESPLPNDVVRNAMGASAEVYAGALHSLQREQLVRAAGLRRMDAIEPFHDKIRQATLAELTPEERVDGHLRLARTLEETPGADASALATHWLEAGDKTRALLHADRAATEAEKALAFERAASLLELCLSLLPQGPDHSAQRVAYHWRLGLAHTSSGKGKLAADAFFGGVAHATAFDRVELQRLAGQQLIYSGHYSEGVDAMRLAVTSAGLFWPATIPQRLWMVLKHRIAARFKKQVPPVRAYTREELQKLDLCWAVVSGMSFTDAILGAAFKSEHLSRALGCSDAPRRLRAVAIEYPFSIAERHRETEVGRHFLREARKTAEAIGTPEAHGFVDMSELVARIFMLKGLTEARALGRSAEERLRVNQRGPTWELRNALLYHNNALYLLGGWKELAERQEQQMEHARARGDLSMVADLSVGAIAYGLLARDDVDEVDRRLEFTASLYPKGRFLHIPLRIGEVMSQINAALYRWDLERAKRFRAIIWDHVGGNMFIRTPVLRYTCCDLIGRASLAVAAASSGSTKKEELQRVRSTARELAKLDNLPSQGSAALLRGGAAVLEGKLEEALSHLEQAERLHEAEQMEMIAACIQVRRGRLMGGANGSALAAKGLARLAAEVRAPEKIVTVLTPFVSPNAPGPKLLT